VKKKNIGGIRMFLIFLKERVRIIKEEFWWTLEESFDTNIDTNINITKIMESSILILVCLSCVFVLTFWWPLILRKIVFWVVFLPGCFILFLNLLYAVFSLIFFVIVKPYKRERIKKWCWQKAWDSRHQSKPIR